MGDTNSTFSFHRRTPKALESSLEQYFTINDVGFVVVFLFSLVCNCVQFGRGNVRSEGVNGYRSRNGVLLPCVC